MQGTRSECAGVSVRVEAMPLKAGGLPHERSLVARRGGETISGHIWREEGQILAEKEIKR